MGKSTPAIESLLKFTYDTGSRNLPPPVVGAVQLFIFRARKHTFKRAANEAPPERFNSTSRFLLKITHNPGLTVVAIRLMMYGRLCFGPEL